MTDANDKEKNTESFNAIDVAESGGKTTTPAEITSTAPQKDIHKTIGGRITDFAIYYGLGFFANSGLSLTLTYGANPRPGVKRAKESIARSLAGWFKGANPTKTLDSTRSFVETCFMVISGFVTTAIMMPLLPRREKIAYKINQLLGRDTDVLPDEMRDKTPKTLEDKINREIDKRVNKKESGSDLWVSRFIGIAVCLVGDGLLNRMDRALEANGKHSITTLSWLGGQKLFAWIPKKWPHKINDWFSRHGASLESMEANSKDHFARLKKAETQFSGNHGTSLNPDRMVIAEQTRLVIKEVSWTLIVAWIVRKLTGVFRDHRVARQQQKVVADLQREGFIPQGYKVIMGETIQLQPENPAAESTNQKSATWADKQSLSRPTIEKSASHIGVVENTRRDAAQTVMAT